MSGTRTAVILFACDPRIEAARKPFVGGRSAAVHAALLADTAERLRSPQAHWDLVFAWRGDEGRAGSLRPHALVQQRGRGFGERLANAAADVAVLGYGRLILVGADCPTLGAADVAAAGARLAEVDVVVGPALDGGINLLAGVVGTWAKIPWLAALPWGTDELLGRLDEQLAQAGLRTARLEPREDIDTVEALSRLLRTDPNGRLARLIRRGTALSQPPRVGQLDASRTPMLLFASPFPKPPSADDDGR